MDNDILKAIYENGMAWLMMGELISADNNTTNEERLKNIQTLSEIGHALTVNECEYMIEVGKNDKQKLTEMVFKGINTLCEEIKNNKQ